MMTRVRSMLLAVLLTGVLASNLVWPAAAQQITIDTFPTDAIVRGENVWLRFDPAEATEILMYLERGDAITITGESVEADGDVFFPVEVVDTGEIGWIRDLFIDPGSIGPAEDVTVDIAAPEEPVDTQAARATRRTNRENRPNRAARNANRGQAQTQDEAAAPSDTFSFSGSAPTVTDPFTVSSGVLTVTATHEGDANFSVLAYSEDGYEDLLINEIGPFDGQTTLEVDPGTTLTLDVDANGPWEVVIEPSF